MTAPSPPKLRRAALAMLGPMEGQPALDEAGWKALDDLAETHRLKPHLHARLTRGELANAPPTWVAHGWAQEHRASAISALAHRGELYRLTRLLKDAGIASAALKGAWLAWHAYPAAAERPVRDVDILVPAEQADAAYALLLAEHYEPEDGAEDYGEAHRHKPPLLSDAGIRIELHSALSDKSDLSFERSVLGTASPGNVGSDPCRYPSAEDMLLHLVLHAVYGEVSLDVGPLVLCDIDYLVTSAPPDWAPFWRRCDAMGVRRGAELVFAMTDRFRRPGIWQLSSQRTALPREILEMVPDLLLQDPAKRKSASLIASVGFAPGDTGKRVLSSLKAPKSGGYAKWLGARISQSLSQFSDPDVRRTGATLNELGQWLQTGE